MKSLFLRILLFPLDLLFFTLDAGVVTWRTIKRKLAREETQKVHFCEGESNGESPHAVRSVLRYQNQWLVRVLAPCITFKRDGKRTMGFCKCDEGYYRPPAYVPLVFLGMLLLWGGVIFGLLLAVSSDPENFGRNFVSTLNPSSMGENTAEVDFLEQDARLNPERAERYFLSGVRFLDQRKFPNAQVDLKIAIQSNPTDPKLHFHLAKAYLGMGQQVQGEASVRKTLEFDPDHVEALLLLSELVQRREEVVEARELAAKALELEPDNLQAVRLNAQLLANQGEKERVRELMDHLLREKGDDPDTLAFLGQLELSLFQDIETARARLEHALELDPDFIPALMGMINVHARDQRGDRVNATLDRVLELDEDNLQALRLRAEMTLNQYGLPAGLRAYESLLAKFGGNLGLRTRYAELLLRAGRISEGKNLAQQLTASRVPQVERSAHWMLAQMYAQARMFEEAIEHARRVLRLSPNARNVHLFLAQNLLNLNQNTQARREAEAALALNPNDLQALNLMTRAMVRLDAEDEAVEMLEQLIADFPDQDALRMRRIEILMQTDSWINAMSDTQMLVEKYPDNAALKNNLAFLLARSGEDVDRAMALSDELSEQFADNPLIMDTRAYVLAATGRHEDALPVYEEALAKAGGNATIRFHYAQSLAALGREGDAVDQLQAVLIMNPDFHQADAARALMESLAGVGG